VTPPTEGDIRIYARAERGNPLLIACKVKFIDNVFTGDYILFICVFIKHDVEERA
jgi:hypothetical protein